MLLCDDVIQMKRNFGQDFRETAVFTALPGARTNGLMKPRIHAGYAASGWSRKERRAFAFKYSNARPTFR